MNPSLFLDTFHDSDNKPLESHMPDVGSGWTLSQTGNLTIQANVMTESTTDASHNIYATFDGGISDGTVPADIATPSGTFATGICGRLNSSGSQRIWFRLANDSYGSGIFVDNTFVASSSISFASSTAYHVQLVFSGTSISAYVNGGLACSTVSGAYATNTSWGILSYAGGGWNAVNFDNFALDAPADQPPVNTVPGTQLTSQETRLVLSSTRGNRISIEAVPV